MKPTNFRHTRIACNVGYITQAIVINLAPIFFVIFSDRYGISNASLGTLVLVNFLVQIFTDIASVRLTARLSMRACAVTAHVFSFTGLVLLGLLPMIIPHTFTALLIATVIYSIGGGLIEVVISPIVDAIPIEETETVSSAKAAAMALLHSFYCWGQLTVVLVSTLLLALIGSDCWHLLPFLWAIIPFVNMFAFIRVPFPKFVSESERTPIRRILTSRLFLLGMLLMICSGAAELTVAQWASMLAEKGLGVSKVVGDILGPCAFALFMGIGRMIYGILGTRLPLTKSLLVCSVTCVLSYIMISLFKNPVVALAGCSVCGISVSLMWPGVLSLTAREFPKGGAALFSLLAISGDIGCSAGPWLTGLVSNAVDTVRLSRLPVFSGLAPEQIALKVGVLASVLFPIIMIFTVIAFINERKSKNK